jgi:hypothetical protein
MAQVRVDESLLNDPRFKKIVREFQSDIDILSLEECEEIALGRCLRAFWLAQKYWRDGRRLVPAEVWDLAGLEKLENAKLADRNSDGIYVRGARDFFDWYHDKSEAGRKGGLKSGEKRRHKHEENPGSSTENSEADEAVLRSNEAELRSIEPVLSCSVLSCSSSVPSLSLSPETGGRPPGPKELAELWNLHSGTLPKVNLSLFKDNNSTQSRWTHAKVRLRADSDLSVWEEAIKRIAKSSWCNGKNPDKWKATFDYLIRPDTLAKALEGKLDDKTGAKQPVVVTTLDDVIKAERGGQ